MKQKDLDKFNSMDADDLNFEILSDDDTVELSNNKLNKAKEVHYSFKSQEMPRSPKKDINKKIQLKSENLIKEVNAIPFTYFDEKTPEMVPLSPKRFMSSRIKQNDCKILNQLNHEQDKIKSSEIDIEENFYSMSDGKIETDDMDDISLKEKLRILENKVINLESDNQKSKDLLSKKNSQIKHLIKEQIESISIRDKEKQMMESKILKLEQQNKLLIAETQ